MRARSIVLVAALLATIPAAPGRAGACPLITDARGDSAPLFYSHTAADDALGARETDILAADAWTDSTRLNAVIRVAALPLPPDAPRSHGFQWSMELRAESGTITLYANESNGYWEYNATWVSLVAGTTGATSTINLRSTEGQRDERHGQIRLATPLAVFAPYTKVSRGVRWQPDVLSYVLNGAPATRPAGIYLPATTVGSQSDRADGMRPIVVGRPECAR
jgi:hypothetical protein